MTLIGSVSYISKYKCNRSVILVNNYQMEDPPQNVSKFVCFSNFTSYIYATIPFLY